jgi:hypothetical protein
VEAIAFRTASRFAGGILGLVDLRGGRRMASTITRPPSAA